MTQAGSQKSPTLGALAAARRALEDAGRPMSVRELTDTMLTSGYWSTTGKTPCDTVQSRISVSA